VKIISQYLTVNLIAIILYGNNGT